VQVSLERVEACCPLRSVRRQPGVELHQRFGTEPVEPPLGVAPDLDEPGVAQHLEVSRHTWLVHADLFDELADGPLAAADGIEDPSASRLGDHLEHRDVVWHDNEHTPYRIYVQAHAPGSASHEARSHGPVCYTGAVADPYFRSVGTGVFPFAHAHAPWGEDMLHGRLLGGLAARALEAARGAPGWRVARLTVDLFRPAAMALVEIEVRTVRAGRRIQVADALIRCDGHDVGRATAVILAESEEPPGRIWRPRYEPWPAPDSIDVSAPGSADHDGWWFRSVQGGFGTGEQTRVWTRETTLLVDDEAISPFVRTALSGDMACPLANSSDRGLHYINADYTMLIGRYPVGEWIGLDVAQQIDADGISMGSATLVDADGPFATSGGVSLARPPMVTPEGTPAP
jgi:hypothetical protein